MFHATIFLLWALVVVRFIHPLRLGLRVELPLAAALLVITQHHLITRLVTGNMFSPEVPGVVMIGVNVVFVTMLLTAVFQTVTDLVMLTLCAIRRRGLLIHRALRPTIAALAFGLAAFGVSQALRVPPVKNVEIAIRNLPEQFEGYRMVQLTDLHLSRVFQRPWTQAVVAATNAIDADLIVLTGDLIDGTIEARRADVEPLAQLRARDGVWVTPGNHEYYFGYKGWMDHYRALGLSTLDNSHTVIARDGARLVLAAVNDINATRFGFAGPDVAKAIEGAPEGAPVILLDHQPRNARAAAGQGVDLQLSGHTHGGMIRGFDRLVARFNEGFVSGLYKLGDMSLYVSNGTALWIGFVVRLGVPSELTVIHLKRA